MNQHSIIVERFPIRLGQFLKLAGVAGDGSEARGLTSSGKVRVNGITERRRGRQLQDGDQVELENCLLICSRRHPPRADHGRT